MKKIKHTIIILQLLLTSMLSHSFAGADVPIDVETKKALEDLQNYCTDVGANPIAYSKNAKDKSIVSVPVEISPGVVKFDTLIKIDHPAGPDYISCFQQFKTPFQAKSLEDRIVVEEKFIATCKEAEKNGVTPVTNLKNGLQEVSENSLVMNRKKLLFHNVQIT